MAIGFVDIVVSASQSKELDEAEFVDWIERFEAEVTSAVVDLGGQVVKTMGDETLFVVDDPRRAAEIGLVLTARGSDGDGRFPAVRVGIAYGTVVHRLGDVIGTTVNIAARLRGCNVCVGPTTLEPGAAAGRDAPRMRRPPPTICAWRRLVLRL